jgi:ADP-heptose:LPS heptosyltransferase
MGPGREQLTELGSSTAIVDLGDRVGDFNNTAALLQNLDLVITCDSSPAHLAGATGRPVWVALPFASDWRWLLEGEETRWYPGMRLFRQPSIGDWPSVFQRIERELAMLVEFRGTAGAI